jgi:uncharacterized membrane protein (GlpM family)
MWQMFLVRMLGAGLVAATVPLVANRLGAKFAGVVMLVPVISIFSLYFLGKDQGGGAVRSAALGSLQGLPFLALFLVVVVLMAGHFSLVVSLMSALVVWLLAVIASFQLKVLYLPIASFLLIGLRKTRVLYVQHYNQKTQP